MQVNIGYEPSAHNYPVLAILTTWQKVLANSSAKSLHGEIKLKQGLCFENLKDYTKAEQAYSSAQQCRIVFLKKGLKSPRDFHGEVRRRNFCF